MSRNNPQPIRRDPPEMWIRIRYTKTGPARFGSHRDFARAFERVLRRAEIPVAYSSGFSPHIRISFANVAPTGSASLAEYVELGLAESMDLAVLKARINEQMPQGMQITEAVQTKRGAIQTELKHSIWEATPFTGAGIAQAVSRLMASPSCEVTREGAKGAKTLDVRSSIMELNVAANVLRVTLSHGEPLVRPADVVAALETLGCALNEAPLYTRLEQF
jgi:radical SAM-linked protein